MRLPLVAALAWAVLGAGWRERLVACLLGLTLALVGEALIVTALGGPLPLAATARAFGLAALLLLIVDGLLHLARRWGGRIASLLAALALIMVLSLPGPGAAAAQWVMSGMLPGAGAGSGQSSPTRRLAVLTALPIIWGEGDLADMLAGRAGPADIQYLLRQSYLVTPLDRADGGALGGHRLLLLAQPRALDPLELVAIDDWIRSGGQALILADPALAWPSRWPVGDPRRAPPVSLLDPLLAHWGLTLAGPADPRAPLIQLADGRRIETIGAGRFRTRNSACRLARGGLVADCAIGRGRAILVADADLIDGRQWMGPGPLGGSRAQRRADNAVLVLNWLAALSGQPDSPNREAVAWIGPGRDLGTAVTIGLMPALFVLAVALLLGWRRVEPIGEITGRSGEGLGGDKNKPGTQTSETVKTEEIQPQIPV